MAKMGSVDFAQLKKLQENLNKLADEEKLNQFCEKCARELAARLLEKVIKRTPVGIYSGESYTCESGQSHKGKKVPGKVGGTLRRGWTANKGNGSDGLKTRGASQFVDTLKVNHFGNTYVIEIVNSVDYAPYVEFGHRTPNHKKWIPGHFMMTISENEIRQMAPRLLEKKLQKFLGEAFHA